MTHTRRIGAKQLTPLHMVTPRLKVMGMNSQSVKHYSSMTIVGREARFLVIPMVTVVKIVMTTGMRKEEEEKERGAKSTLTE